MNNVANLTNYIPAYQDTVDNNPPIDQSIASGGPPVLGLCGEKEIVDVDTPNFVEYKLLGTDPLVGPFIFEYKGAFAQESDIGVV